MSGTALALRRALWPVPDRPLPSLPPPRKADPPHLLRGDRLHREQNRRERALRRQGRGIGVHGQAAAPRPGEDGGNGGDPLPRGDPPALPCRGKGLPARRAELPGPLLLRRGRADPLPPVRHGEHPRRRRPVPSVPREAGKKTIKKQPSVRRSPRAVIFSGSVTSRFPRDPSHCHTGSFRSARP